IAALALLDGEACMVHAGTKACHSRAPLGHHRDGWPNSKTAAQAYHERVSGFCACGWLKIGAVYERRFDVNGCPVRKLPRHDSCNGGRVHIPEVIRALDAHECRDL